MNSIVVVDNQWGIGKDNNLLFRLKKDMAFFKATTTGKVVVVGAKTFDAFPRGALPDRINIVLDDTGRKRDGATTVRSVRELELELEKYDSENVFVIGGAQVYALLLDRCKFAFVTKVSYDGKAQVFFPNLDEKTNWKLVETGEPIQDGEYEICFCKYENMNI